MKLISFLNTSHSEIVKKCFRLNVMTEQYYYGNSGYTVAGIWRAFSFYFFFNLHSRYEEKHFKAKLADFQKNRDLTNL